MTTKFFNDMTFEEWANEQNRNGIEFKAILKMHMHYPGYSLEEIKNVIYTQTIITENNQQIYIENFGQRHPDSTKLNASFDRLANILTSTSSEFKSVDNRGHSDVITIRLGGRGKNSTKISFRIEEKAIRYARYLIEHNLALGCQNIADVARAGFVKYAEMLPIILDINDPVTNRFLLDMQTERQKLNRLAVDSMLEGFDEVISIKEEDMTKILRHIDNREELIEMRDWLVKFINDALSYYGPTKTEKGMVKDFIMKNFKLFHILSDLEREGLVTREYIDNLRQKGDIIDVEPKEK